MNINYKENIIINIDQILNLYNALKWSSAKKPIQLQKALQNSDTLITAWHDDILIGLGNAISDGYLVVYYPHLAVHPDYRQTGIGSEIMRRLKSKYEGFHQHVVVADNNALGFYKKAGFVNTQNCSSLWIYDGNDH